MWKSAVKYFALAAAILAGNTIVLGVLVEQMNMNHFVAKLLTELIFFTLSWLVQRFLIFKKKGAARDEIN